MLRCAGVVETDIVTTDDGSSRMVLKSHRWRSLWVLGAGIRHHSQNDENAFQR